MRNRQITRGGATATALVFVAALLGACTDPEPTPSSSRSTSARSSTPPPSPTPSVDPTIAQAEAAILEAYQGYWDAKVASFAKPSAPPDSNLARFAVDTALTDAQSALISMERNGIAFRGTPVLNPVVSDVVVGDAGTATITDCVDVADWQPYFQATNESAAAPGQATEVLTVSTAYFFDERWTIRASDVNRTSSC